MGGMLAWMAWVACLCGWRASVGSVGGVLAWVTCWLGSVLNWVMLLACWRGCQPG